MTALSTSSTNDVNTANPAYAVSTVNSNINTACPQVSTANFSDNTVYDFMVENPNGSNLLQQDLEQIHEDDLEAMDLIVAALFASMRAKKQGNNEDTSSKAMLAIDGVGFDWSDMAEEQVQTNIALMAFSDSELLLIKGGPGQYICCQNHKLIADIENDIMDPMRYSMRMLAKVTRSQDGKDDKDNDKGSKSRSQSMKEQAYNKEQRERPRPHKLNDESNLIDLMKEYFNEFDGGYVAFRGGAYGGRITGKGILKTDSLYFEDVYFVNELKFKLFSVLQMCDKKNYVLFTDTECLVLSPNFKLPDENQILLKIPRKDNMYSFNIKNIVPKESLTCLVAKATSDELMQ
ncbi:hypothetical protein Tco_1004740 [Tanacetum coccineum]|uniref:Uncharacterized protein n=1 Tax=Tanacetum coccineum TaxID=301880 RepID=A0ABQ5FF81_9ASTR